MCVYSDDDMQSIASLMSLQQKENCSDNNDVRWPHDDETVADVANMADVDDDDGGTQTCLPVLSDIHQLVSRSVSAPHTHNVIVCLVQYIASERI